MSLIPTVRSQLTNLLAFRAFFPPGRVVRDGLRIPLDHLLRGGLRPFPLVVDLNVTNRCGLACDFCYNRENVVRKRDELGFDEIASLVDEAAEFGAGFFLSGGEPLQRDDLVPLVERIHARGLAVGLVTNGALLDPDTTARLLRAGCDSVVVSVHGAAAVNDAIVGREGVHATAMRAVRQLAAAMGPPGPIVNCVVSERSVPGLRGFLDEALSIRNCVVRLAHLSYVTTEEAAAHERSWSARLPGVPSELLTYRHDPPAGAFDDLLAILADRRYRRMLARPSLSAREAAAWYAPGFANPRRCTFLRHSTVVNADGTVFPCQYYGTPMGNVREQRLASIWTSDRYRRFRATVREGLLPGCARCCKL